MTHSQTTTERTLEKLPCVRILCDGQFNCRGVVERADVEEFAKQLAHEGLKQPIVVRPIEHPDYDHQIVAGHRRFTAIAKVNNDEIIEAIVDPELVDDEKARIFNLAENIQREDLDFKGELNAICALLELDLNQTQIAKRLGKSDFWVGQRVKALALPISIINDLTRGDLKLSQIDELYVCTHYSNQDRLYTTAEEMKRCNFQRRNFKRHKALNKKTVKRPRTRAEVESMIDHMCEFFDVEQVMMISALAWVNGHMKDEVLYDKLRVFAANNPDKLLAGVPDYKIPLS